MCVFTGLVHGDGALTDGVIGPLNWSVLGVTFFHKKSC